MAGSSKEKTLAANTEDECYVSVVIQDFSKEKTFAANTTFYMGLIILFCIAIVAILITLGLFFSPSSQICDAIQGYIIRPCIILITIAGIAGLYDTIMYFMFWSVEIEPKYSRRFWIGFVSLFGSFAAFIGACLPVIFSASHTTEYNQFNRNVQPLVEYCLQDAKIPQSLEWEKFYIIWWQDTVILGVFTIPESDLNAFLPPDKWKWEKPESKAQLEEYWKTLSDPPRRFFKTYQPDFTDFARYTIIQTDPRPGKYMQTLFVPVEENDAAESKSSAAPSSGSKEKRYRVWLHWFDT